MLKCHNAIDMIHVRLVYVLVTNSLFGSSNLLYSLHSKTWGSNEYEPVWTVFLFSFWVNTVNNIGHKAAKFVVLVNFVVYF